MKIKGRKEKVEDRIMSTINDVAKIANVSTSTVSHVVNKTRYVSPDLVERVEKAIQELESPPNFVLKKSSRKMYTSKGEYILLLITDKGSNFQKQVERQIEAELSDSEYILITMRIAKDVSETADFIKLLMNTQKISGIILFPDDEDILARQELKKQRIPAVILGKEVKGFLADTISSDTFDGAYRAIKHLIDKGHEHIGFLGSKKSRYSMRLDGYKKALADYKLDKEDYVYPSLENEREVFDALDEMMMGRVAPTAIFAANYAVVISLLKYMEVHNIVCPDDISVVSFNNFEWAQLHTPAITTIEQDIVKFAKMAVKILLERIENQEYVNQITNKAVYKNVILPTKITVRSSTCGIGRGPFGEKAASAGNLILSADDVVKIRQMKKTAAISFHYAGKAWTELHQKGIKDVFDSIGISLIAVTDAHFDWELQCKQLESLQLLEPDIIIAIPTDNKKTSQAFKKVAGGKAELILIANVPEGLSPDDYVTCVSINERSHGQNMGHGLGNYMLKHGLENYGLVTHSADFYATNQRDNAVKQVMEEEYASLNFCEELQFYKEDELLQKTREYINRHPALEALYVSWDGPALEVIAALREMGRSEIAIITGDLDQQGAIIMAKGGMIKMIGAQLPYEQGQAIAWAAANRILGKEVPSFIGIEPISVTADSLLKSWQRVFQEAPGEELLKAFKENPNYVTMEES